MSKPLCAITVAKADEHGIAEMQLFITDDTLCQMVADILFSQGCEAVHLMSTVDYLAENYQSLTGVVEVPREISS